MDKSAAAYTVKHSGWPFTEENLIGEFIELPRAEHEAMLAEIERLKKLLACSASTASNSRKGHTIHAN